MNCKWKELFNYAYSLSSMAQNWMTEPVCCTSKCGETASSRLALFRQLVRLSTRSKNMFRRRFRARDAMHLSNVVPIWKQRQRDFFLQNSNKSPDDPCVMILLSNLSNWPATHTISWHESEVHVLLQLTQSANKQASFSESFEYNNRFSRDNNCDVKSKLSASS